MLGAEIERDRIAVGKKISSKSCGQKDEQQQVEKLSQLKDLVSDARGAVVILTAADQPLSPATALCSTSEWKDPPQSYKSD